MSWVPGQGDYEPTRPKYYHAEPAISPTLKKVFVEHAGLKEEEIVPHVKRVRDKAWSSFPYPCIGSFAFLEIATKMHPLSAEILSRLQSGQNETYLDLGCCFAQDIRYLVVEGAPAQNLTGFELRREYIDYGYELFRDEDKLSSRFVVGDLFDEACGLEENSFDIIHASMIFHLFDWEEQVQSISKTVGLLKQKAGSLIFGRAVGSEAEDYFSHPTTRSGQMFRNSLSSWQRLVAEVAQKTGTQLEAHAEWDPTGIRDENLKKEGFQMMMFSIKMIKPRAL